jgi:NAD(P)-dependent dehydrogenase (short-subunit alcohol dehydrogenase family)
LAALRRLERVNAGALGTALDFSGRVVLVTGGTKGIGRSIAARFEEAGATVVVCGRTKPDDDADVAGRFITCDVRDPEQVGAMVSDIATSEERLDVVVNNAGGSPIADTATASPRFTESIIRLNLLAPLHVAQAVNRIMQGQDDGGSIVNISSVSGIRATPNAAAYGAAKAGLLNLTQTLAVEWAPRVRVNAVTVGLVRTEQANLHYGDEAAIAAVGATVPLGRMAEPVAVADACVFLASPLASYISGANLLVHGGGERPAYLNAADPR